MRAGCWVVSQFDFSSMWLRFVARSRREKHSSKEQSQCLASPVFFATVETACTTEETTLLSKILGIM